MLFHTWGQSRVFLGMMYAGLLIGACYDLLRFTAKALQAGRPLQALLDAVFGVLVAAILIIAMVGTNFGDMRAYLILGAACGLTLYAYTVHPLLRFIVLRPARWALRRARRIFSMPWANKVFK